MSLKTKDSCLSTDGRIYISPFGWSPNLPPRVLANLGMLWSWTSIGDTEIPLSVLLHFPTSWQHTHLSFLGCSSASLALVELFWQFAMNWTKIWLRLKLFLSKVSLIFFYVLEPETIFPGHLRGWQGRTDLLKTSVSPEEIYFKLDMWSPAENVSAPINTGVYQDFGVAIVSWTSKILIFHHIWEIHSCKNVFLICNFVSISLDIT